MTLNAKVRNIQNQKGFTLVEIAIVMVIIGLLIGGVLKGQSMIQNAKVKRVIKQADELRAGIMTFYDKYSAYPGDEDNPNFPPNDSNPGNGSGQINANEAPLVFEDLKNAGIIGGDYDGTNLPNHAFGDTVRVYYLNALTMGNNHYIRFDMLPGDVCMEIDLKLDDGVYNTGSIRGSAAYGTSTIPQFYMPF